MMPYQNTIIVVASVVAAIYLSWLEFSPEFSEAAQQIEVIDTKCSQMPSEKMTAEQKKICETLATFSGMAGEKRRGPAEGAK